MLLSRNPADHDVARDQIAALLTQNNGEYILRIGERPAHEELFAGDLKDNSPGWTGTAKTLTEIDLLRDQISQTVEEVGGKVC